MTLLTQGETHSAVLKAIDTEIKNLKSMCASYALDFTLKGGEDNKLSCLLYSAKVEALEKIKRSIQKEVTTQYNAKVANNKENN
ncbi:hypothetical protein NVP1101O_218 [Vibrio phage 1.101.O._10N.261.45.C6]|nr:hypothetical protein NVP1101O_218 [Vibrio phage 1.101.O._10N.261.45.C6]